MNYLAILTRGDRILKREERERRARQAVKDRVER